jgi:CHAD domain-containing protein
VTPSLYSHFARRLISEHLDGVLKEQSGVIKNRNSEYLHRMRVSSRRLRTVLWVFKNSFSKKDYRYLRVNTRMLTRALGQARDLDTELIFLKEYRLVPALLKQRESKRKALQNKVVSAIRGFNQKHIAERLNKVSMTLPKLTKNDLQSIAHKKIKRCLEKLYVNKKYVHDYKRHDELHALRIAAKHLRYTLESFEPLFENKLSIFRRKIEKIQALLGKMRNHQVWTREFKRLKKDANTEKLIHFCHREAEKSYKEFVKEWDRQEENRVWKRLEEYCS